MDNINQMDTTIVPSNQSRWWDLPAIFLLIIIITTGFSRLVATDWTSGLDITRTVAYLGLIAGLALGMSRFSPRLALIISTIYGAFIIPWRIGLTMGVGIDWRERLVSLAGRLDTIFTYLFQRKPVPDSLLFLVLMACLFWVLGVHAGYHLSRHGNSWMAILPTGVALVLIHSYDAYNTRYVWYLIAFLFFSMLLVARMVFIQNRERWLESKTHLPPYLGIDFIRIALVISLLLIMLSWAAPALAENLPAAARAWQTIKRPWENIRGTFDNAFASLKSTIGVASQSYGSTASLGRGSTHSDAQIFTVITPNNPPQGLRYYWRARVYDDYADGQWSSTLDTSENIDPSQPVLTIPSYSDLAPGIFSFSFTAARPLSTLFSINQANWISRPTRIDLAINPDNTVDVGHIRAAPSISAGETYYVRAKLAQITIAAMQQAGSTYPEWITKRYLQLPPDFTERTKQLALQITAGKDTPYDKTLAITQYLRENIQYSEVIDQPLPVNQEPIDWFLFDLKKGFCNYYATAEVMLLREAGVPARIAFGYAQGEVLEGSTNTYVVRERDSHAWPEVFFPNLGWVEFEPTVAQPALIRPQGSVASDNKANQATPTPQTTASDSKPPEIPKNNPNLAINATKDNSYLIIGGITGLVLILVLLLIPVVRRKKIVERIPSISIMLEKGFRRAGIQPPLYLRFLAQRAALAPIARAYLEINLALARIGKRPNPTDTPAERVVTLVSEIPPAEAPAQSLLSQYQLTTYSPLTTSDSSSATRAAAEIRLLSFKVFIRKLLNRD